MLWAFGIYTRLPPRIAFKGKLPSLQIGLSALESSRVGPTFMDCVFFFGLSALERGGGGGGGVL
jgi:hypothetical protein